MAKNAAKKAVGIETSHAQLLDLVGELEQKLKTLQIVVAFDIHAGIAQVLQKQQELMDQVQKRLKARPSGLEVPRDTAEAIAELVGMEIGQPDSAEGSAERKAWVARVVNDLRVDNRELWGQVHEKLDHIGAEVHETNRGVQDLHRKFDLHMNLGGNVKASNTKAADFWKTYFTGTDNVTWKIFVIALKEEFSFDDHSLDLIRSYLDVDADGSISILEFNVRTAKDGVEGTCLKALQGPSNMNKGAVPTEVLPLSPSRSLPPSLSLSPDLSRSLPVPLSLPPSQVLSLHCAFICIYAPAASAQHSEAQAQAHAYARARGRSLLANAPEALSIRNPKSEHRKSTKLGDECALCVLVRCLAVRVSLSVIVCVCVHELYS
jgi:hypothetical protein